MTIQAIELTNFRSYGSRRFELHPKATLIVGPNASGKTNLLEGLYVLAVTKSFRAKERDLISHGEDFFRLVALTDEATVAYSLSTASGGIEKRVMHDDTRRTLVSHIGTIQVILFEPTDLELVSGSPDGRRRYLDFLLSQTDQGYMRTLSSYRRVLKHRNALLEGIEIPSLKEQLFAWDLQLSQLAGEIYRKRISLVNSINTVLPGLYADISGSKVALELEYIPSIVTSSDIYEEVFLDTLAKNLRKDLGAGFTTIGPHREDFKIHFKGSIITSVASRGETRTAVLACKLAELQYAEMTTGVKPLLLLDDVFSELDSNRRTYLLKRLGEYQTIITTTDADAITEELTTPHSVIHTGSIS